MLNVLATECMKLRRNKLVLILSIVAVLLPIVLIGKDIVQFKGRPPIDILTWLPSLSQVCQLIIYPVLGGFILTFLIQKEYGDHTIINTLTAPVKRVTFIIGKIVIWFIWQLLLTVIFTLISCCGAYLLYGQQTLLEFLPKVILSGLLNGLLSWAVFTPIAWMAVLQRENSYTSLIFTLLFTVIGAFAMYFPLEVVRFIPWTAVTLMSATYMTAISWPVCLSIGGCAALGLFMACHSFMRQEL